MSSRTALTAALTVGLGAFTASACAGTGPSPPSPPKPSTVPAAAHYPVTTRSTFPRFQRLAQQTDLTIAVRNVGGHTIPNVAVTITNPRDGAAVGSFATSLDMPGLASHSRPVWILLRSPGPCRFSCRQLGPGGAATASASTWALGALKPGATATFVWRLTAVKAGTFRVAYRIAADLTGNARAVLGNGSPAAGNFTVNISATPPRQFVTPDGRIVTVG